MAMQHPVDRTFISNGLKLHYLEWGSPNATPLILIHHMNSHAHTWDRFADSMSEQYRVLALDMRGHGDSQWADPGNYKTVDFASDVEALVNHLGVSRAIILGGSVGGRVALVYAGQHQEQTAALIVEDVGPVRTAESAASFPAMAKVADPEFNDVSEAIAYWKAHPGGHGDYRPDEAWEHIAQHSIKRKANGKFTFKRDKAMFGDFETLALWDHVESIKCPFLLILGDASSTVSEEHRDRMIQSIPDSTLVTVERAGHIVLHDKPQEYERAVRSFLKEHNL
ncbi:MAG: hypothetical protein BZY82_00260 [SAR202 cluster bacterium Io17-Chloro-G3]|nr:MAG: hypothetical protein BZY82_00260 [SAR202 cluster bacterium Io17-Chloro-G3]